MGEWGEKKRLEATPVLQGPVAAGVCGRGRGGGDTGRGRGDRWVGGWGELGEKMSVGGG